MEFFVLLIFYFFFGNFLIKVFSNLLLLEDNIKNTLFKSFILLPFQPLTYLFKIFKQDNFMSFLEQKKVFKSSNKGFVVDGNKKRISKEESFQNVLVTGSAGTGKSTVFIYSNIFTLSRNRFKNSLIVLDPKSEFILRTSAYLKKHGYEVYSLNPTELNQSIYYNPLANIRDDADIDQVSRIIVSSMYNGHIREEDKFWINGAIKIIFIIIHSLIKTKKESICNLPNVLNCLNNFGNKGETLDKLVANYASTKIYTMWLGLLNSNENILLSFLSTAQNALLTISVNPNIEKLLTKNTFNFKELREKRIALFINISPTISEQTAFLTSLFYTELFDTITPIPSKHQADIFCLFDELGQYKISPKLPTYMTFLRASRVAFMGILQDFQQLHNKYGINNANVITNGGVSTKIYFTPNATDVANDISKRIGLKKVKQKNGTFIKDEVMPLNEVLTMKKNEVLLFHSSYKPVKLKVKKYFEVSRFKIYSKLKPYINIQKTKTIVSYIDFRNL